VGELVAPVLEGRAEVAMSLRSNSLGLYRWIGLDFVSGRAGAAGGAGAGRGGGHARPAALGRGGAPERAGDRTGLRLAVVDWPDVRNVRKGEKVGAWRGLAAELKMVRDALSVLTPWGVVRQNVALLSLKAPSRVGRGAGVPSIEGRWPGRRMASKAVRSARRVQMLASRRA
jgi:hypothetical protein